MTLQKCLFVPFFLAVTSSALAQGGPPVITNQPQSQVVTQGMSAVFSVGVQTLTYPTYQWRFDGSNLFGATSNTFWIVNVQATNAGDYSVAITNSVGWAISSNATLTVLAPPVITTQPLSISRLQGGSAKFSVTASGTMPLRYQWNFNGANLSTGTNPDLQLVNLQAWQAGIYSVAVSNDLGWAISSNAVLTVRLDPGLVACWGNDTNGESTIPAGFSGGCKAIAAGGAHSLALRTNGMIFGWGDNTYGQLNVPPEATNVTAIAAGYYHNLALNADGTVTAWGGNNGFGELNVPTGLFDVVGIAAGAHHNLALKRDGTVVAWGSDSDGQIDVPLNLSNVVAIAAGYYHSLALTRTGVVIGWGRDLSGEIDVPMGLTDVVALSAGDSYSLALSANRTVTAWGDNSFGQTNVPAVLGLVAAISAGGYHALALKPNGTVVAWGQDTFGQSDVPFGVSTMVAVSAGAYHSLALKGDGTPVITVQPVSQHVNPGDTASFAVLAVGNAALAYQWHFNDVDLDGATKNTFTLANAQLSDSGRYSVTISNALATALSSNATLAVGNAVLLQPGGFAADGFHIQVTGPGGVYLLQATPDFANWGIVTTTNAPPGVLVLTDPDAFSFTARFYRVVLQ